MNKKGFTLIEMIAVLALTVVILALILPTVSTVLVQSEDTVYAVKINTILKSAYDYTLKNVEYLPEYGNTKYITLAHLKQSNLIDSDITNPISKELFLDNLVISIRNVGSNYKEKLTDSLIKGDYLYRIENEFMGSNKFIDSAPIIDFPAYDNNQVIFNINVGDQYDDVEYTATASTGEDLYNRVVEIITYNKKRVNKVDTGKPGIYYVSYSVIDDNGYSASEKVSIIISDSEVPNLIIPDNLTISKDVKKINLMKGVVCQDNSGDCEITIIGDINYGTPGKYIIEYKANDPSGNTKTAKRVITVSE